MNRECSIEICPNCDSEDLKSELIRFTVVYEPCNGKIQTLKREAEPQDIKLYRNLGAECPPIIEWQVSAKCGEITSHKPHGIPVDGTEIYQYTCVNCGYSEQVDILAERG